MIFSFIIIPLRVNKRAMRDIFLIIEA